MKLKDLVVSPVNVRETPNREDETIKALAESIDQNSMISRIVLRAGEDDKYEIVAGCRRYHALLMAHGEEYEITDKDYVIFQDMGDDDALLLSISENQQRQSLSPYELNRAALKLNHAGKKDKEIAYILNITPHRLKRITRLSQDFQRMPDEVRNELKKPAAESVFTDAHWDKLKDVEDPDVIKDVVDYIMEKECPPRDIPTILKSVERNYEAMNGTTEDGNSEEASQSAPADENVDPFEFTHKGLLRLEENGDEKSLKVIGRKGEEEEIPIQYYLDYLRYPEKFKCTVTFKLKVKPIID
jgi:ParB/RepB/Spo0J family partition protein